MIVDFSHVWMIRISLFLQTLENHFEVSIDNEGNLELVIPTVESQEGILLGHVDPHCFMACATFEVFIPGLFALESLEAVQAEVIFVLELPVTTSE